MKRICVLLLAVLLLSACQPTPEADAVKQKNTNVLIDTVQQEQEQAEPLPVYTDTDAQSRFQCDFTTSTASVHVTADVPIELLSETGSFPTLRVAHRYLSDAERMLLAQRLLGSESLYVWEYRLTRELLEQQIRIYIQEPTPEEKESWMRETGSTEADWDALQKSRQTQLEMLQKQYNELPADAPSPSLPTWDGSVPDFCEEYSRHNDQVIVRGAYDTDALERLDYVTVWANEADRPIEFKTAETDSLDMTSVWFFANGKKDTVRIRPEDYDKPYGNAVVSPDMAIAKLQAIFDGVGSFRAADVFWTNNGTENEQGKLIVTRSAYLIVLTTDFYGANTPYCRAMVYDNAETNVIRSWSNEVLMAVVDGEGSLISLCWLAPLEVTDVIAERTKLLSDDALQSIFEEQIGRQLVGDEYRNSSLCVDSVQLGLYRVREQSSFDTGLLVPAWFFTGTLTYSESVQTERLQIGFQDWETFRFDSLNPLLIVNAVDGSIIDPQKGY